MHSRPAITRPLADRHVQHGPPRWAYNKNLLDTKARRIRLQVIPNNLAPTLDTFVLANVEPGSVILTDDHPSYVNLSRFGYMHEAGICPGTRRLLGSGRGSRVHHLQIGLRRGRRGRAGCRPRRSAGAMPPVGMPESAAADRGC